MNLSVKLRSGLVGIILKSLRRSELLRKVPKSFERSLHTNYPVFAKAVQLIISEYGDPALVVKKESIDLSESLEKDQVLVKTVASPINPADINTIQGTYAIKPEVPFVGGNEGVFEVSSKSADVTSLDVGDKVIPKLNAMGTWTSNAVFNASDLLKIPPDIPTPLAATISVNPCTAYRMLHDFVTLREGDCVIQNCANSGVGQAVIQIASSMGVKTVNIVRKRPNLGELKDFLMSLGATCVITEEDTRNWREKIDLPKPILGLNGVSGKPGTDLLRQLNEGGTMVTYGGMSRKPITVGIGSLIFGDVRIRGFWMTRWKKVSDDESVNKMLDALFTLAREGKLKAPPHEFVHVDEYKSALQNAMPAGGRVGKKQLLCFN